MDEQHFMVTVDDEQQSMANEVLHVLATCSSRDEQLNALQQAWLASSMTSIEAGSILGRLSSAQSVDAQLNVLRCVHAERQTIAALDSAVAPVVMQPPALRLVLRTVKSQDGLTPARVAQCLNQLQEMCFLSAQQATEIMAEITPRVSTTDIFKYWHVVCSRVVASRG